MIYSTVLVASVIATLAAAQAQACSPLHVIWTRATGEAPQGSTGAAFEAAAAKTSSKGYGMFGIQLINNLKPLISGATGHATNYPANMGGCQSEDPGVADVLNEFTTMAKKCPDQKYVFGGHSQRGVVTMRALRKMDKSMLSKVLAITMVGSPPCKNLISEIGDRCKSYCNKGDPICEDDGGDKAKGRCPADGGRSGIALRHSSYSSVSDFEDSDADFEMVARGLLVVDKFPLDVRQAQCTEPEPAETGHQVSGHPHGGYDFYMKAAACYIFNKYKGGNGTVV